MFVLTIIVVLLSIVSVQKANTIANTCDNYVHPVYGKGKCVHESRCANNLYISDTCESYQSTSVKCCYSQIIPQSDCASYTHVTYGQGQCLFNCSLINSNYELDGYCDGTLNKCCFNTLQTSKPRACGLSLTKGKGICLSALNVNKCVNNDYIQSGSECNTNEICCYGLQSNVEFYEFRGLWVSTVANIDWPSTRTLTTAQQKEQLLNIIEMADSINLNALIFQIRPAGDALYASLVEPWSFYLTNEQGKAPNPLWDPLKYICDEAHKRNIEVHAWFNPYRAKNKGESYTLASTHMAIKYAQYAYAYNGYIWMDPSSIQVKNHTLSVIQDVLLRYNVDGIHFDDYFYPYPDGTNEFPDAAQYQLYTQQGGTMSKSDWRRDNVNKMIRDVYALVKRVKPRVHFGVSPFGIWRPNNPQGIQGFDAYSQIYCDAKLWLQSGWLDYIVPQLYWQIDPPAQSYPRLLQWWCQQNTQRKLVYAGNALYKLQNNNWSPIEIERQIQISRDLRNITSYGNIHFTTNYLMSNYKGIRDSLKQLQLKPVLTPFKAF